MCRGIVLYLLAVAMMALAFGAITVSAQTNLWMELTGPGAQGPPGTITTGQPVTFEIHMNNSTGNTILSMTNGFQLCPQLPNDPPGTTVWSPPTYTLEGGIETYWELVFAVYEGSLTGSGADTIGLAGSSVINGVPPGYNDVILKITTTVPASQAGKDLVLDSSWIPSSGKWWWAWHGGSLEPSWGGPYGFDLLNGTAGASISGTKFHDENGNSVWDGGETPIDNVTIRLHGALDAGGTVDLSTLTDALGDYIFAGLEPGDYYVLEDVNPSWAAQTYPLTVFHTVADVQSSDNLTGFNFGNDTLCDDNAFVTSETCLHGTNDNFTGPEPSNISPGLLAFMTTQYDYITEFDHPALNQCFGHTFEGCWDDQCLVVGATLRVKLRGSSGGTTTDWMAVGDYSQGNNGRIWSSTLNDLDADMGGDGVWNLGEVMIATLDLADLFPRGWLPTNILGALQDGNLDIVVSDDTEVDFIEMEVTLCCPNGTICGYKFNDLNGDGVWDKPAEQGLSGWTITLDDGYMLYPQVTDQNGEYCFTGLAAGHYSVYEMNQAGWTQTYPGFAQYEIDLPTGGTSDWSIEDVDFGNFLCDTSEHEFVVDTCLAGIKDDFAPPTEPASPSAGLLATMQAISGGANPFFDSDLFNRCFGHSFDACWTQDCPIISAHLCLKVKALPIGFSDNDVLALGDWSAGPGPSTWSIDMEDLYAYATGNPPTYTPGTVIEVCLDLANLPVTGNGPSNLLPYLQDKKLDVLIQDDTNVDYLELIVELCCPDCCRLRGDLNHDGVIDIADLVYMVDWMFAGGPPPPCPKEADLNGDGVVDIADLVYLVDYMFTGGPAPAPCDYPAPPLKVSGQQTDISFDLEYANGNSTVVMNSTIDLRGIQLELKGVGPAPQNLVGDHVDLVHGRTGETVKVGLLDLNGGEIIGAGTREVVRFEGKYTLESVTVADENARSITPTIGSVGKRNELPTSYALSQNYPNPFNPSTSINFALPEAAEVKLEVFNLLGQRVNIIVNQRLEAGYHTAEWDGRNELGRAAASGVYFYRLETPRFTESRKMVLLK